MEKKGFDTNYVEGAIAQYQRDLASIDKEIEEEAERLQASAKQLYDAKGEVVRQEKRHAEFEERSKENTARLLREMGKIEGMITQLNRLLSGSLHGDDSKAGE